MSIALTTAGHPGVPRCSEATTVKKTSRRRQRSPVCKSFPWPCLPFITDEPGRIPSRCFFDVPAEGYSEGNLRGMRLFGDYMAALQSKEAAGCAQWVLRDVFGAMASPGDEVSRCGAAVGFVSMLVEALHLAAVRLDHSALVNAHTQRFSAFLAAQEAIELARKRMFVERMRAGRDAKRARDAA